jgi:hypothetical protein
MDTRKHTKLLMERVDDQWQPKKDDQGSHYMRNLIRDLLDFMSESDVEEFCDQYGYNEYADEEEEIEEEEIE